MWSNEKYESVEHRVRVNSEKERLSIPFFFNPSHYVMVKPLQSWLMSKTHLNTRSIIGEYFMLQKERVILRNSM